MRGAHRQRAGGLRHRNLLGPEDILRQVAHVHNLGLRQAGEIHRLQLKPLEFCAVLPRILGHQRAMLVQRHGKAVRRQRQRARRLVVGRIVQIEAHQPARHACIHRRLDAERAIHLLNHLLRVGVNVKTLFVQLRIQHWRGPQPAVALRIERLVLVWRGVGGQLIQVLRHHRVVRVQVARARQRSQRLGLFAHHAVPGCLLHKLRHQVALCHLLRARINRIAGVELHGLFVLMPRIFKTLFGKQLAAVQIKFCRAPAVFCAHRLGLAGLRIGRGSCRFLRHSCLQAQHQQHGNRVPLHGSTCVASSAASDAAHTSGSSASSSSYFEWPVATAITGR